VSTRAACTARLRASMMADTIDHTFTMAVHSWYTCTANTTEVNFASSTSQCLAQQVPHRRHWECGVGPQHPASLCEVLEQRNGSEVRSSQSEQRRAHSGTHAMCIQNIQVDVHRACSEVPLSSVSSDVKHASGTQCARRTCKLDVTVPSPQRRPPQVHNQRLITRRHTRSLEPGSTRRLPG
jgi:hypothetical protein